MISLVLILLFILLICLYFEGKSRANRNNKPDAKTRKGSKSTKWWNDEEK
jgi:uncharacterized membrane protein YhaH (DUF805 family)